MGLTSVGAEEWHVAVTQALQIWEWRLNRDNLNRIDCPFPITIAPAADEGACEIRLVEPGLWIHGDRDGVEADCYIEIKGPSPRLSVLVHELGHAIGLEHSDDAASIMNERVRANGEPTDDDIRAARDVLGCSP